MIRTLARAAVIAAAGMDRRHRPDLRRTPIQRRVRRGPHPLTLMTPAVTAALLWAVVIAAVAAYFVVGH